MSAEHTKRLTKLALLICVALFCHKVDPVAKVIIDSGGMVLTINSVSIYNIDADDLPTTLFNDGRAQMNCLHVDKNKGRTYQDESRNSDCIFPLDSALPWDGT